MRSWISLFKKEIRGMLFTILVAVLLVTAWEVYLTTKINSWPLGLTFGLGFIPFVIFPLIMLVNGYQSFRQEWKNDTIYLLKSLPRSGKELVSAKLVSNILVYVILTLYTFGLHMFFHWAQVKLVLKQMPEPTSSIVSTRMIVFLVITYLVMGIIPYIISQFSYLVSCVFNRLRWLISIVVFILSHYLLIRLGGFISRLFNWMPDIPLDVTWSGPYGSEVTTMYLGSGPIIASLLILIGFFLTGSWILEKQLDV